MCALLRVPEGRKWRQPSLVMLGNGVTARSSVDEAVGMTAANAHDETRKTHEKEKPSC
jgi:hypothetical protein